MAERMFVRGLLLHILRCLIQCNAVVLSVAFVKRPHNLTNSPFNCTKNVLYYYHKQYIERM